jgi:hypothetical protein
MRPYTWGGPGTIGASPSGKAADFGSAIPGSNPGAPAIAFDQPNCLWSLGKDAFSIVIPRGAGNMRVSK